MAAIAAAEEGGDHHQLLSPLPRSAANAAPCSPQSIGNIFLSSSPLPSPSAMLREISRRAALRLPAAKQVQDDVEKPAVVWEIPDSEEERGGGRGAAAAAAPKLKPRRRKPAAKTASTTATAVAKPRGRQKKVATTTTGVSGLKRKASYDDGLRSKYFVHLEEPANLKEQEKDQPTTKIASSTTTATTTIAAAAATTNKAGQSKPKERRAVAAEAPLVIPETPSSSPPPSPLPPSSSRFRRQWTPVTDSTPGPATHHHHHHQTPPDAREENEPTSSPKLSFGREIGIPRYPGDVSYSYEEEQQQQERKGEQTAGNIQFKEEQQQQQPQKGEQTAGNIHFEEPGPPAALARNGQLEVIELANSRTKKATVMAPQPKKRTVAKSKTKKKTAQTITEQASAQYRKGVPASSPITEFFSALKKPPSRSTKPKAPSKLVAPAKRKRKDEGEEGPALLSPVSAKQRIDSQGFVFGTCSQLERESIEDDCPPLDASARVTPPKSPGAARAVGGLWDAANRDQDGGLLGLDVPFTLDFSNYGGGGYTSSGQYEEPPSPRHEESQCPRGMVDIEPGEEEARRRPVAIDLTLPSSPVPLFPEHRQSCSSEQNNNDNALRHSSPAHCFGVPASNISIPTCAQPIQLPAASPKQNFSTSAAAAKKRSRTRKAPTPPLPPPPTALGSEAPVGGPKIMPDFSVYTKPQLQSELSKFGFKKIGSKAALVATMEECWKAQNSNHPPPEGDDDDEELRSRSRKRTKSRSKSRSKVRSKSRSRSRSRSVTGSDEEVEEGGEEKRPRSAPKRSKKAKKFTSTKRSVEDDKTLHLHAKISEAIKVPDGTNANARRPNSFHLKILMYDPVVLEDLAVWLNDGGLKSVGCNLDINVADLRHWCNEHGVCCLARETNRGRQRKRF